MDNCIVHILKNCNFKGFYFIDNLPNFQCGSSYIIYIDHVVHFAVIFYNSEKIVVFNAASKLVAIPPELIEQLSYLTNVTLLNFDINFLVKHLLGTCTYFIYHCMNSIENVTNIFPINNSYIQHMDNIHDFLKVKSPEHFNKW